MRSEINEYDAVQKAAEKFVERLSPRDVFVLGGRGN